MLISIITPTFNAGLTLDETLESVRQQLRHDTEHLLMDAGSTDRTLDVAKEYPYLIVRSESDRGIYDGMNKGAGFARGEWLLFLQGDDWLPSGALDAYRQTIQEYPMADVICGSAEAVKELSGLWSTVWSVSDKNRKKLTIEDIALGEPMINARLFRKSYFEKLGGFSLQYSLASDRDFLLRAAKAGVVQQQVDVMTYRYRWHAGSSTMSEGNALTARLSKENLAIVKVHLPMATGNTRKALRTWHDRLTIQAAMNALENFQWKDLVRASREGTSENSRWIFCFVGEILRSFPGFISRGRKSRTRLLMERNSL